MDRDVEIQIVSNEFAERKLHWLSYPQTGIPKGFTFFRVDCFPNFIMNTLPRDTTMT